MMKWKLPILSLITVLLFFVILELILWIGGVPTLLSERDPFHGFSEQVRVFQADKEKGIYKIPRRAILHSFKIKELRLNFRVGLDNPADTAVVVGITDFIRLFWKPSFPHEIDIRADYEGDVVLVEGYTHLVVRVFPILIVTSLLRFLFSWRTIKAVRIMVASR